MSQDRYEATHGYPPPEPPDERLHTARHKFGREIVVGDVLAYTPAGFRVARFGPYDPPTGGPGRIAYNHAGEGMVVFEDHTQIVLDWVTL